MVPQNRQGTSQATRNGGSRDTQTHPPAPLVSRGFSGAHLLPPSLPSPPANWEPSLPRAVFSLCRAEKGTFSGQLPPASGRRRAGHITPGAGEGGRRVRLRPARCVPRPRGESLVEGRSAPWWTFRVARPPFPSVLRRLGGACPSAKCRAPPVLGGFHAPPLSRLAAPSLLAPFKPLRSRGTRGRTSRRGQTFEKAPFVGANQRSRGARARARRSGAHEGGGGRHLFFLPPLEATCVPVSC